MEINEKLSVIPESENSSDSKIPEVAKLKTISRRKPVDRPMRVILICKEMIAYERIAMMQLSACLKESGHEVRAAIMNSVNPLPGLKTVMGEVGKPGLMGEAQIEELIRDWKPDIIAYTAMTGEHYSLLDFNRKMRKKYDFYAMMGGPHAMFNTQVLDDEGLDAVCTGEGDVSFPEFVTSMKNGGEYWLTETFFVKHDGRLFTNALRELVGDLNDLPFPDRQLVYDADPNIAAVGQKSFHTSRGCPYRCSYCFNKKYNDNYKGLGQIIRCRSPENVVKEIEWVKDRYNLSMISFVDDIFFLKPNGWLEEFAKLYKERIGLPFNGNVRANVLKEKDVALLADAGLSFVWMGVECGNDEAANKVFLRDGSSTSDVILKASALFRKYGVKIIALNIMGLPVDNPFEIDMETLDLNLKIKPALASVGLLYPYPGTPVAAYAIENGYFTADKPFYYESNKNHSMLTFKSKKEKMMCENLQKLAGITVEFPFLRRFVKTLCKLPLTKLYHFAFYMHMSYCHKVRLSPIKNKRKELPVYAGTLLRVMLKN
ncbi:B12-binding domain-containing radical SAM protein [Candidatus Nitrosopelagicus sp.]|nr:B12-binding domain-containing radical SAM protein [Candidatus Nitrosopelagicus sp.]